jgi:mono/diheme cytochrome c family protein
LHKLRNSVAVAVVVGLGMSSPGMAQSNMVGEAAFADACAVCHGPNGQGDGEFASVLTIKPPDLTTISMRNDGQFPYLKVFQIVDGRTTMRAHGTSVMPIWGDYFSREVAGGSGGYGTELMVRARIVALVDYIETLQK